MESFVAFFSTIPFWYWWVFAAGLLVIELLSGSTYFLWPAIAAALVGFLSIWPLTDAWQLQLFIFAGLTVVLSFFAPRYVKPWLHQSQADHFTLNERGAQKIGRRVNIDQNFVNGSGKVRLGDTLWLADSETGEDLVAGAEVEITRTEGTKLYVKAV